MPALLHQRYEVQSELTATALNIVLFALDRHTGDRCVIKAARRGVCVEGRHSELCCQLVAEGWTLQALAAAKIAGPRAIDFFHMNHCPYLVLRRVPGFNLQTLCDRGQVGTHDILDALIQICGILQAVHQLGYVHGDVKPANIMRCPSGRALLIDWGSALPLARRVSAYSASLTIGYASPEQIQGHVGISNDIFALGRTLEALVPYPSERVRRIIDGAIAPLGQRYSQVGRMQTRLQRIQLLERLIRSFGATVLHG